MHIPTPEKLSSVFKYYLLSILGPLETIRININTECILQIVKRFNVSCIQTKVRYKVKLSLCLTN
jgi:hypothetical protein